MRAQNAAAACPAFFSKGTLHVAHHPPPTHLRMDPLCARSTLSVISHTRRNTPSTPDTPKPSTTFWVSLREGRTNREVGLHPWPAFPRRRLWCRPWAAPSPSWRAARLPQPTSPAPPPPPPCCLPPPTPHPPTTPHHHHHPPTHPPPEGHHLRLGQGEALVKQAGEVHVHCGCRNDVCVFFVGVVGAGTNTGGGDSSGGSGGSSRSSGRLSRTSSSNRAPASPVTQSIRMFSPCRSPSPTMWPTMHHTAAGRRKGR